MSTQLSKKSVARNYAFLAVMLGACLLYTSDAADE